ncbi:MAG: hypothetical protein MJ175_04660 [Clostridia bacterium]|nr:hypothetical protein [Clostridia bacterium]
MTLHFKTSLCRLAVIVCTFALLLGTVLPLSVSAEGTAAGGIRAEAVKMVSDDGVSCTTGYLIYADASIAPIGLEVYTGVKELDSMQLCSDAWIVVNSLAKPDSGEAGADGADENAQVQDDIPQPCYMVDFLRPAEGGDMPGYLHSVTVGGAELYALAPDTDIAFCVLTEENKDAAKDLVFGEPMTGYYVFSLDRPQKLLAKLTQEDPEAVENENGETVVPAPGTSGSLSAVCYAPAGIRHLAKLLAEDRDRMLSQYGFSDLKLSVRYQFGDSAASDEEYPTCDFPLTFDEANYLIKHSFDMNDPAFRACFPEDTFLVYEEEVPEGEEAPAEPKAPVYYIDKSLTTIPVRAAFVLTATPLNSPAEIDDPRVEFVSAYTDVFNCGASNSLISDPTVLDAPAVSMIGYDEDAMALSFSLNLADNVREAAVWADMVSGGAVTYSVDISVNGEEWHEAVIEPFGGNILTAEKITVLLSDEAMTDYAYIRVRMNTAVTDGDGNPVLTSAWSDSLAYDKRPAEIVTTPPETETLPMYTETEAPGEHKYVCSLCGICPAPYGICLFLWIGAALLIVLIIVLIIAMIPKKHKCPRCGERCGYQDKTCPACGYRFVGSMPEIEDDTGEQDVVNMSDASSDAASDDFGIEMPKDDGAEKALPIEDTAETETITNFDDLFRRQKDERSAVKKPVIRIPMDENAAVTEVTDISAAVKAQAAADAAPAEMVSAEKKAEEAASVESVPAETVSAEKVSVETAPVANAPAEAAVVVPKTVKLPEVTPQFLTELKRKMNAAKAGQPQSFTPAEAAYIRALKEKTAADKAAKAAVAAKAMAAKEAAVKAAEAAAAEAAKTAETAEAAETAAAVPAEDKPVDPMEAKTVEFKIPDKRTAVDRMVAEAEANSRFTAEQTAMLRKLRTKQLTEEQEKAILAEMKREPVFPAPGTVLDYGDEKAAPAADDRSAVTSSDAMKENAGKAETVKADAEPRRVQKPVRMIKCDACAVPNPETNERCYICGHILPRN